MKHFIRTSYALRLGVLFFVLLSAVGVGTQYVDRATAAGWNVFADYDERKCSHHTVGSDTFDQANFTFDYSTPSGANSPYVTISMREYDDDTSSGVGSFTEMYRLDVDEDTTETITMVPGTDDITMGDGGLIDHFDSYQIKMQIWNMENSVPVQKDHHTFTLRHEEIPADEVECTPYTIESVNAHTLEHDHSGPSSDTFDMDVHITTPNNAVTPYIEIWDESDVYNPELLHSEYVGVDIRNINYSIDDILAPSQHQLVQYILRVKLFDYHDGKQDTSAEYLSHPL